MQWLHLQTRPITCKVSGTAVLSCIQSPCLLGSLASYLDYQLPKSLSCPRQPCNPGPQQDPSALRLHLSPGGKCDLQGHILQRRAKEEAPLLPQAPGQQHRVKRAGRTARSRRQARRSLPRDGDLFPSQMQARITRPQLSCRALAWLTLCREGFLLPCLPSHGDGDLTGKAVAVQTVPISPCPGQH